MKVDYLKQLNIDMEKSFNARSILEGYNLMDIVVADESMEIAKFLFDDGNIIILFNGFQKKTQKTPKQEIEKAIKLKNQYYAEKQ